MRKTPFSLTLIGVVLLAVGLLTTAGASAQARAQEAGLRRDAGAAASAFQAYLDRARGLDLLLAQNPAFMTDLSTPANLAAANEALKYLEVLYPGAIGETCIIADDGQELARVVDGVLAQGPDLSPDESANPFFTPTLSHPVGHVYQAAPYISPDTHKWVIS